VDDPYRSRCPINLSLEVFGDRWTLLIIRDMVFAGKRHYREFLESGEGISTNILADRLRKLVKERIITGVGDSNHKQRTFYSLTEKGIALVPAMVRIGAWGLHYMPVSKEQGAQALALERGGHRALVRLMSRLRAAHLGLGSRRQRGEPSNPRRSKSSR
jgi:DNA-binding HxlR family transcriptional regulator